MNWAVAQIQTDGKIIVKIFKARPQEKQARVIIEVTSDGWRGISQGRQFPISNLKKAVQRVQEKEK